MATLAVSPRRALSQEEKKQRDAHYKVDVKEFSKVLKQMAKVFQSLAMLNAALGRAGKGAYLTFPSPDPAHAGAVIPFTRKHLRSANSMFANQIKLLRHYLRVSKKKTRDQVRPESFSGTYTPVFAGDALRAFFTMNPGNFGPLGPIHSTFGNNREEADQFIVARMQALQQAADALNQASQALQALQEPEKNPPKDATDEVIALHKEAVKQYRDTKNAYYAAQDHYNRFSNLSLAAEGQQDARSIGNKLNEALMAHLPRASEGYLLRNTSTMLFYVYAHAYVDPNTGQQGLQAVDNAQFARSDEVMMAAFGGQIPASFVSYRSGKQPIKIPMNEAVEKGIVERPLNTYEVIVSLYPPGTTNNKGVEVGFNPNRFNTYYYQNIAAANYFSKAALLADPALAQVATYLADPGIRQSMLQEHNVVKAVSEEWHDLLEPGRKQQREIRKKLKDARDKQNKLVGYAQ